ncbi:DEAD-box ATP-dependent RNA helicase 31 [Durusdinium trenchii]|uniref:ATP-dependent RNA helicase n=1 Tax=Durusdinium trenchii TaxID=1381693 RepID=A0ABP0NCN9_9DINO
MAAGYKPGDAAAESEEPLPRFRDLLELSAEGKKAMESFGYERMTAVQRRSFGPILGGGELLARAKTGSGKTLSFLLPAVERIHRQLDGEVQPGGVVMLVLTSVRELSMQVAKEAEKLTSFYGSCRMVCMTGGVPWEEDLKSLDEGQGAVLLVATPGRLQSHVAKTEGFAARLRRVRILVLDEVDQLASETFRAATLEIAAALPPCSERQGLFYSATVSDAVHGLVRQIGRGDGLAFVDVIQSDEVVVPEHIDQYYSLVPTERMTECLWRFLQSHAKPDFKAVAIFMTGRIAAYYAEAFRKAGTDLAVFEIHARRSQKQRTEESERFRAAERGVLFTSDVSSRGLDYPGVTHVVQMGAAHSKAEYIHRLGRCGRAGAKGHGLLLLHDFEEGFLEQLSDLEIMEEPLSQMTEDLPDFIKMPIAKNVKAQAYYSRINHVMRNSTADLLEIMREAHRFARSIGATDEEDRPPEITVENAQKMGVAEIQDVSVHMAK